MSKAGIGDGDDLIEKTIASLREAKRSIDAAKYESWERTEAFLGMKNDLRDLARSIRAEISADGLGMSEDVTGPKLQGWAERIERAIADRP